MARTALLRESDAAEYLGVAADTLRHWRYEGRITYVRLGGPKAAVRYRLGDLDRWIDAHKIEGGVMYPGARLLIVICAAIVAAVQIGAW